VKLVTAIIQPEKLDAVRDTLSGMGIAGMTVTDVKGFGRQKGVSESYRGATSPVDFVVKSKVEVAIPDSHVSPVVEAIRDAAYSGEIGDGKIFVSAIEEALRIRTKEVGEDAV
jgi:nitrogen regulatory protein PII